VYGLMQSEPINLISILGHAGRWHGSQEIITNTVEGGVHRQSYEDTLARATRLASSLQRFGVQPGDRIGTLGWNTHRHLEAWYAISGQGAVCHTINPRLFASQLEYIVRDAEDRLVFVDLTFVDRLGEILQRLPCVEAVVIMTDREHMPDSVPWEAPTLCYEEFLEAGETRFHWPALDDNTASSLCYTSGTTGNPKGVLYSHRGNLLHAYASCMPDIFNLAATDTVLMVVPMFHANSWGLAYAAPLAGAKLALPGPHMDGASLHGMIAAEQVNKAAAVPTVWNTLIAYLNESDNTLDSMTEVIIGGAAVPRSMIEEFENRHNVDVVHAWGMTEMTPIGTFNRPKPGTVNLDPESKLDLSCKQGRVPYGVDMKIVDDQGNELPRDGRTFGALLVKGPWTIARYFKSDDDVAPDGWFDTGDIATIDAEGYMQITDRSKDVIKSGGEWISSVDIENAAMGVAGVEMAACIGASHPKWGERPVLIVSAKSDDETVKDAISDRLATRFAKWQLPDAILFVDQIPLTATGKLDKKRLRVDFRDVLLEPSR